MSVHQGGWASVDSPESRRSLMDKTRLAMAVLCLHLVAFQIIIALVISRDVEMFFGTSTFRVDIGVLFLLFAGLYLAAGVALGLDMPYGRILGLVLSAITIPFWILGLAAHEGGAGLPRSGWFMILSILDSLGIVLGLVILHQVGRSLRGLGEASSGTRD